MKQINFKHFLATAVLLLLSVSSWSADGDTFTANLSEGLSMKFQIISENEKTCQVGRDRDVCISQSYNGAISIPSSIFGYSVTSIGDDAFRGCSDLTSIHIPESVTSIGDDAFRGCSGLTSIHIPEGVTSIGSSAFEGCSGLTSINIPEGVTSIGISTFKGCSGLTSINIPEGVTSIDFEAFNGCSGLTSINIPESVTTIGSYAFKGCKGISKPTYNSKFFVRLPVSYKGKYAIPETIEEICDYAFSDCLGLTSINISESVTSTGQYAFLNCFRLTAITIPKGVRSIDYYAFGNCSGLTSINIPEGVTRIESSAFYNCSSLTSITIPESVTFIGDRAFSDCSGLTSITVNGNIFLGQEAFKRVHPKYVEINGDITTNTNPNWGTSRLAELRIGDRVTTLYKQLFSGCKALKKVTLGKSLKYIRNDNFTGCTSLDSVICYSEEPPYCYPGVFDGASIEKCTLVVQDEAGEKYENTEPWNKFGKIVYKKPTFILTYMIDGEVYKTVEVEKGANITPESTPEREGYTFSGWSNLPESMPAENVTVTGTFTINQYWVTYEVDGKTYTSEKLEYGSAIMPPTMQEKEGCDFVWEDYPENVPASDITIKGCYVPRTYILTYILDGEEYKTIEVTYGSYIQAEEIAEREGYTFSGWDGLPGTMPAGNVTVTGHYTVNEYWVTYMVDGKPYTSEKVAYGSVIVPPEVPEKEGFEFEWSYIPDSMPAKDIMVYGSYTTGIAEIMADRNVVSIYSIDGKHLSRPQRGLNIIRMKDGTVKRVMVK